MLSHFSNAQLGLDNLFNSSYMITNNDTIKCFVKAQGGYEKNIPFKFSNGGKLMMAKLDTVKFIINDFNSYGRIEYNGKYKMARILCWGKINYYEFQKLSRPTGDHTKGWAHQRDIVTNYLEKDSVIIKTRSNKMTEQIRLLFKDNTQLYEETNVRRLKQEQLIKLIQKYNNACQQ